MNILNRNLTIKTIKNKKFWYKQFIESKFMIKPRVENYYFGVFSRKQVK
jgi:hypothetical protein